jgi:hypothetical protein
MLVAAPLAAQEPVRTGDITLRGLKTTDFPRVKKLAENVYTFEQIDPTKRVVTVNNLIVVTSEARSSSRARGPRRTSGSCWRKSARLRRSR